MQSRHFHSRALAPFGCGAAFVALCMAAHPCQADELSAFESFAGARRISGVVFIDTNGDGMRNGSEAGLPGVRLLANKRVAVTGPDGAYTMASNTPFLTLSVSFPSGFWPTGNRWFHRPAAAVEEHVDFGLQPERQDLPFLFVHFTDPHVGFAEAVANIPADSTAWPVRPRFYLCSGDLRSTTVSVADPTAIRRDFGAMREVNGKSSVPLFGVPGNHDVVDLESRAVLTPEKTEHPLFGERAWEKWVGPASWSFVCGGVLFVGQEWAEYTEQGWQSGTPAIRQWVAAERAAQPVGTRAVLLCHAAPALNCELALSGHTHALGPSYGDERRLMGGQSGRHYTSELWNADRARREEEPFVESVPVRTKPELFRRYGEDGCPSGYRLVAVFPDRMDTFYKVIDEPRTILVNTPRRHRPIPATNGVFTVRGQVFDPQAELTTVTVACGGSPVTATLTRSLLWADFAAVIDTREWPDGYRALVVRAVWPDRAFRLEERYLWFTGRTDQLKVDADAVLSGWPERGKAPTEVQLNGKVVGIVQPGQGKFSFVVSAAILKRLNVVTLTDDGPDTLVLKNVHLSYGGDRFVDQRLTSGFGMGRSLRRDQPAYLDLKVPGKVTPWKVTED